MGTVLDTTVFVEFERATRTLPAEHAMQAVGDRLEDRLGSDDEIAISTITASELLHGVHSATEKHRARREAFVASVLDAFPVLSFDLLVARVTEERVAQLFAYGAHDRIVAATAMSVGLRVGTANMRHFGRIPGLDAKLVSLT